MIQLIMVIITMSKNKADKALPDLVYDANEERWAYYQNIYSSFKIEPKFLYRNTNKTRLVGRFTYSYDNITDTIKITHKIENEPQEMINENESQEMTIVLSGDCFFNFSEKKINLFIKTIKPKKEETLKLLKSCAANYQSDENCVLMPVTGAMNNIKGKAYFLQNGTLAISGYGPSPFNAYDRPDTLFICYISFIVKRKRSYRYTMQVYSLAAAYFVIL